MEHASLVPGHGVTRRCEFSIVVGFGGSRLHQSLLDTFSVLILVVAEFDGGFLPGCSRDRVPAFRLRHGFQGCRFSPARQFPLRLVPIGLGCIRRRPTINLRQFGSAIANHFIANRSDAVSMDHDRAFAQWFCIHSLSFLLTKHGAFSGMEQ